MASEDRDPPDGPLDEARTYFSSAFPAEAGECARTTESHDVGLSGRPPHDDLVEHLFSCSACFEAYRRGLDEGRERGALAIASDLDLTPAPASAETTGVAGGSRSRPMRRPLAAAAAVAVVAGAFWYLRPAPPAHVEAPFEVTSPAPEVTSARFEATVPFPAAPLRGQTQPDAASIVDVPAGQGTLTGLLPGQVLPGDYALALVDPFDRVIVDVSTVSVAENRFVVDVDLSNVAPGFYYLRARHDGEPPWTAPLRIVGASESR